MTVFEMMVGVPPAGGTTLPTMIRDLYVLEIYSGPLNCFGMSAYFFSAISGVTPVTGEMDGARGRRLVVV